ncbi:MAG: diadenylate cyclase CdaA [Thermomicrobiales bacterium]|nr:diadenylate cyclase CdaA [Thermomicrobiales bacterium]
MPELPWIFTRLDPRALIDILAVSLIFFWLLWFAQRTRAAQLIRGLIILIVTVLAASRIFDLTALNWLISRAWPMLIVAIPIIFQPELRRALEQLGHTSAWLRPPFAVPADRDAERTLDEISRAASQLSRIGYGALIVVERETGLQEYADRGVRIEGVVSRQLLINIFFPNSPLHDGAVIIRNDKIVAAAAILPLSEREIPGGKIGTRHQAAIGITEESDAIAIVVSEETNRISIAHNGRLTENLDAERLRRALRSLLRVGESADEQPPEKPSATRNFIDRVRGWFSRPSNSDATHNVSSSSSRRQLPDKSNPHD